MLARAGWPETRTATGPSHPRELGCPVRPSQHGPRAAGASACTLHCPRHPMIQRDVPSVQRERGFMCFLGQRFFMKRSTSCEEHLVFLISPHQLSADGFFLPQLLSFPKIHAFLSGEVVASVCALLGEGKESGSALHTQPPWLPERWKGRLRMPVVWHAHLHPLPSMHLRFP